MGASERVVVEGGEGGASKMSPDIGPALKRMGLTRADTAYYIVRTTGPGVSAVKQRMLGLGAEVLSYVRYYSFIVRMDGKTVDSVAGLGEVEWIGAYRPEHRISKELRAHLASLESSPEVAGRRGARVGRDVVLDIHAFSAEGVADVRELVKRRGGRVEKVTQNRYVRKIRVRVPAALVDGLAELTEVRIMYKHAPIEENSDKAAEIMQVAEVWNTHGLTGTNQVIGHTDSGLDVGVTGALMNADFRGRIRAAFAWGRTNLNDWSDYSGHGTHTAGSIMGNGANSSGLYRGLAYEAEIVHQSGKDEDGSYGNMPDWGVLLEQAYTNGARIHSLSLASGMGGAYSSGIEVDTWSWNGGSPKELLLVSAAGNFGDAANTVGSPATAKNCLTVGSTYNDRPALGADDTNAVATSSARGPTDEGRIKPDVVAPGHWVVAPKTHAFTTAFEDDFESGLNGWTEENAAGPAVTPWFKTTVDSRSTANAWRYNATGPFDDFLVAPATMVTTGDGPFYVNFALKGTFDNVSLFCAFSTNGAPWQYISVFGGQYTGTFTNWRVFTVGVPEAMRGHSVTVALNPYDASSGTDSANFFVDDFAISTFFSSDDLWPWGLATRGDNVDTNYTLMKGTSMATPLAAGAAALVRQFYEDKKSHSPSAALVKGTLINGATDITPGTPRPDNDAGWGRVDLEYSLFPPAPRTIMFSDVTNGLAEGETDTVAISVTNSSEELRVTLVWSDAPGATLQNDLDLELTAPSMTTTSRSDSVNNIEGIDVPSPEVGTWVVEVSAPTVPSGPQPYALVVSGAVVPSTAPIPPGGFSGQAAGGSRIDLSWTRNASNDNVMVLANTNDVFVVPTNGSAYTPGTYMGPAQVLYNGGGTNFSHTNLSAGTLYYYRAWSVDGDLVYSPGVGARVRTALVPPQSESFETGFGCWRNSSISEIAWQTNALGTPSSSTGPAAAHDGAVYVYTEASTPGYPNKTFAFEADFDFAGLTRAELSFYYHMYGAGMGTLSVDIYDGSWHLGEWSLSGQQQTSEGAAWSNAVVDLTGYAGKSFVTIRFRGTSGGSFTSDMAVDAVHVLSPAPTVDHFEWSAVGARQVLDAPFQVVVKARDSITNTVTTFTNAVSIQGMVGGGVSVTSRVSNAGFESGGASWAATKQGLYTQAEEDQSSGAMPTEGTNYWRSYTHHNQLLNTGDFARINQDVDFTGVDTLKFDAKLYTPGVWGDLVKAEVLVGGTSVWTRTAQGEYLDQEVDVSSYTGVQSLELRSEVIVSAALSSHWVMYDNLRTAGVGAQTISVAPTNSTAFVGGAWTGSVTVLEFATNMCLRADDGDGHTGDSGQFDVGCMLAVTAGANGTVPVTGGWYHAGSDVAVTGAPDAYYDFAAWSGSGTGGIVSGSVTSSAITVRMSASYGLFAGFAARLAPRGTPEWWLASHDLTNGTFAQEELWDTDGDGMVAWREYIADTVPTNGASVLRVNGIDFGVNGTKIDWQGGVLATQWLERCTNLAAPAPAWQPVVTNVPPTATSTNHTDAAATNGPGGFYRIKARR